MDENISVEPNLNKSSFVPQEIFMNLNVYSLFFNGEN